MEQSIILARQLVQLAHRVESASLGLGRCVVTGAGDDYELYAEAEETPSEILAKRLFVLSKYLA